MNERYRLTIDGGTDKAFTKEYTKEELEQRKKHISDSYAGRFKVDVVQDADLNNIDDANTYTVKIGDSWQKDYTGAELRTKLDHLDSTYAGRYSVESAAGSYTDLNTLFPPSPKDTLDTFMEENSSFLRGFEERDSAQRKANAAAGMPVEMMGAPTAEERQRYAELHEQEETLKKAWYTSDEYLQQQESEAARLAQMRDAMDEQRVQYAAANPVIEGSSLSATRGAEADKELQMYETASRIMDDTIKLHNAPNRYNNDGFWNKIRGFFKGSKDEASDIDMWTAGLTEISDNLGVRNVLSTVQSKLGNLNDLSEEAIENILTPGEKAVLQSWATHAQKQLERQDNLALGYQAGQGATQSLGFMAEFALTGGVGKAATEGVEQMTKWLSKKVLTSGVIGKTDEAADIALKKAGEVMSKNAFAKYGKNLALSLAEAAGRTGVMPSTYRNIAEKATEIQTDENGNNYLIDMNNAFTKGLADSFIENLSEGGRVNALGELVGDVAGMIPSYAKLIDKLSHTKAGELYEALKGAGITTVLRAGGWHGIGEEYLEEWYGNALRTLTGVDKEALKQYATVDNQIVTLTSFLPMTIFGGTVGTYQVLSARKDLDKKAEALKSALLQRGYDEAQADNMIDMMRGASPSEVSDVLTPIVNAVAQRNENEAAALMKPVGNFAKAVRKWQSFDTKYRYQEQEQRDNLRAQMEESLGQFWQTDDNGRQTVQRGVNEKGEAVYLLGKPSAEDAENSVTPQVAAITSDGRKVFVNPAEYQLQDELEMNDFLANEIMAEKGNKERARIAEEKDAAIAQIKQLSSPGTAINIGTEEAPAQAIIVQRSADGVIVNMPDGQTRQLTYEELGNYMEISTTPLTDAQIDEQRADALLADMAQREAALDQEYENDDDAIVELSDAENAIEQSEAATESLPLKADGSVDQTALWNKEPERWAQWNDEQRQDGGVNSLAYVNGAILKEQAKIAELQAAYEAESDFDARDAIEKEIADTQARVERLTAIQQGYVAQAEAAVAPVVAAEISPTQNESVQSAPAIIQRERTIESVLASLVDGTLSDEEIRANIEANLAEAQKAYDQYARKAPKMGIDKDAYLTKKQKYEQGLSTLQQEMDFWNNVKRAYVGIMQQETMPTEESFRTVLTIEDMEPSTPQELAARELGLKEGGIKLLWDSVKAHTGWGNGERSKFFGIFRSKEKGGMTIEAAGDRLMEIDREYGLGLLDQSDSMAGVNAILDVLGETNTIGDLRNYIVSNREAQLAREATAAYSAIMTEYEATYGETMEERAHYDEVMRSEILINALSENEQRELNNIIFVEEISQNGTEGYQTEASGVHGTETGSNATDVEPGTEGVYTGGVGILQETQSDNSGRDAESQESQRRSESEGGEQNALPSVPSGESTTAVGPSLDEDMPDYTSSASAYFPSDEMKRKFSVMRDRINQWSQKLGIQVRIMETLDDVTNQSARKQIQKGGKVYGYFDTATGEVAFYLPDFLSIKGRELTEGELLSEIDKTYMHEVVSHRGLRGLLGEEKYNELCDMVWNAMTEKQKSNFLNYPGVNGNTRVAADEFIAHFAENVDYNDNRTLWDKIVDFIKNFFNSVGLPSDISNETLAELLRQSYRNLAKNAAAIDTNANKQAEGNTVLRAANGSLVGMHNISEDKLRKVLKQGGLANPSTAVVNIAEYLLDGYGDISLIMPSSLVDANTGDNIGTYTGDAWTPTYPPISRKVDDNGWEMIKDRIRAAVGEESGLYSDIVRGVDNFLDDNRNSKLEFVFLKEKGIEPEIAYKGADGFVGLRNLEAILGVQGLRDGLESYERYKNASPIAKRSFNMWLDAAGNKQAHRELKEQLKKEPKLADVLKLNEDVAFADFDTFTYDIFRKEQDAGKIDTYDTMGAAARYVDANNLRGEFEAWLESLMEQAGANEVFFAGYTRSGERIYKDNTLENVSRHMRLQGRTNAYDDHGLSATKSALLQRLTSLSQIRKNRARLQNEATYNKEYDALKDRLWSIISQLADMQEISSNQFMNVDYAESRLQEAFTKRNPIAHLNKEYGYEIDPAGEFATEINSFIKDVQQMPAKYFETKFERPVYLNEFAAAVMPTITSEDIKQAISEAGLPIFEYDSSVEGSRKEATLKATEGEGIRFRTTSDVNSQFNAELQQQIDGTLPSGHIYQLGMPSRILRSTGIADAPIQLNSTRLEDKAKNFGHDFDLSEIKDLVNALQSPMGIFAYGDKSKAQNIVVEIQHEGKNFIVGLAIKPTVNGRVLDVNSIRNVFPKDNAEWLNWILQDKALYLDKEKIQALIDQQRTNLADVEYFDLDSIAKIVQNFENPSIENIRFRFIGKKGAANLDKAEEATIRLDNLAVAKKMEKAGKKAKDIKFATGWERGADKLWRYEEPDFWIDGQGEDYLDQPTERKSLSEYVDKYDWEYFVKAYPELSDLQIEITEFDEYGGGYYDGWEHLIVLRPSNGLEFNKAGVMHEVQHAIQLVEGFTSGGGPELFADGWLYGLNTDTLLHALRIREQAEADVAVGRYKRIGNAINHAAKIYDYQADKSVDKEESVEVAKYRDSNELYKFIVSGKKDAERKYFRLAGEVEARNVEDRYKRGWGNGEYRYHLAEETEDVARKDQIFLEDALTAAIPSDIRFRVSNDNQAIFVSNAAKAVEGIKQEKATPEQWLKMIEKNGGLKAGEDKWMGLSDFLKSSDKKTLTKQEVLDFINENMIVIEEQHYSEGDDSLDAKWQEIQESLQAIFDEYVAESEDMNDDMFMKTHYDYAIQKLADELGYSAFNAPFINNNAIVELEFYEDDLDTLHELSNKLGLEKYDGTRNINDTRLSYTTEGLKNRHEIALTVPTIEPWNERDEIHFGDAGDGRAVAWIRFGDAKKLLGTTEVDGKKKFNWAKVLVIDEIQSKRHQEGRERGYISKEKERELREKFEKAKERFFALDESLREKYGSDFVNAESNDEYMEILSPEDYREYMNAQMDFSDARLEMNNPRYDAVPDAPFDKNWHELAMKRMLRYAAENGYDVIAWTKGDQQADRYNIGGVVKDIDVADVTKGRFVYLSMKNGNIIKFIVNSEGTVIDGNSDYKGKQLADIVGKELSLRILNAENGTTLSGDDLRIGGEGMKGFYDKILPAFMNKYGKKWGVKVEDIDLSHLESGLTMHSIPVTEEMKASVMEGQVMFRTIPITKEVQDEMDVISATAIVRGNYLKAPNGADTNLTPEQWAMVRTKAFKAWFGDWELPHKMIDVVRGSMAHSFANFDDARQWAKDNIVRVYSNEETNGKGEIEISNNAVKKYLSGSAVKKSDSKDLHLAVLKILPSVIRNGVIAETHADYMKNENGERTAESRTNPDITIHRVYGAVRIGDDIYRVKVTLKEHRDENRPNSPHSYEATKIELLAGTLVGANGSNPNTNNSISTANLLKGVEKSYESGKYLLDDYSKVIDENGEPMVVYHGSDWNPTDEQSGDAVFMKDRRGIWFTGDIKRAQRFADARTEDGSGVVSAVFLNIRKPSDREYPEGNNDDWRLYYELGYDGWLSWDGKKLFTAVVHSPSQIKSATDNTGEFSADNNDIRFRTKYDVNTNPTEAQKKAGNYKMGHIRLDGYNITIENPKGSVRRGTDSKGNAWENTLNNDYGYIRGTEGVDGDHIDVYLSDNPAEGNVFVIDQVNPETREFDEHKVMYGFNSAEEAREAYLANFSEGWNGLGTITEVSKDEFKKWIESSHRKTKPFSEYKSVRANEMQATDESELRYRVVSDQETLDRLNSEPTIKVYRAMQLIDGKLYPPMSAKVDGELRQPIELGQWEEAEERPDLVDEKGRFKLDKGNKSSLKARYNPYFHTSPTPLNDQFSSAQTRPELVTVEVEVPESELTSGYKAEKAKDSVGKMEWKAGVVQSKLSGTRTVILSRWDKPVRIVPDSEVAGVIVDMFEGRDITMPSNVVTPSLRAELEKRGVPFVETDNQGNPVEEVSFRITGTPTDEVVANGLKLTPAQTAEVAANIFAALPEESRKKITDSLNGNILGLQDAILQIPTSLASKESWNEEDKQMADIVAEEMTKMAGEMTRPFSASEGLWLLYNNLNKGTDLISQASRALVQRNLGFDAETLAVQEQSREDVRFRTVGDATSNAQASLYNKGAANVWTRLKESFVDMNASVEELVKAIEKRTGKVTQGFENILMALNQQSSKGLAAMESYTQKFLNPMFKAIREIMDKTKLKYEDIVRYVILKHGLERNKKLAQRDAKAHYQEIYDDIISKINSMDDRQKRTYLTNAQLKEADAKANLATLQAADMSSMTDEERKEHKKKLAKAHEAVKEAEEYRERAEKIRSMSEQEVRDELDKIFGKIENGTDSVFKEMRENDYSGISSMFYDQLGVDRKNFSTEEQYQAALMEAKKDRYSSLKDIETAAEAEVKSFEGKTDTKELWKRINAATKETLRQQYEANMISKDQYLNLRDMFEYYVPLRGFKENTAEDMYTYYRKPNSTGYTKPILGAEGRKTEAESPFGWIAAMAGSAIASNVKNEAKLALYYFVSNRPENGIATISRTWFVDSGEVDERGRKIFKPAYPPFSEDLSSDAAKANYEAWQENMRELQKKGQAYEAGQRLNLGNAVVNISDRNKPEHIVNVKVGGKDYSIIINGNPRAAQAINGDLNIEGTSQDYSALFGPVLRWMSSVNTSYNPEFWITNMQRDVLFTFMNVNASKDPEFRRKFAKNYVKAFKVIKMAAQNENGNIGDSYLEKMYQDFVKNGGVTGYTQIKDSEEWENEISKYMKANDSESIMNGVVMSKMKDGFHALHRFGESLEQVSRFAAFVTAREMGSPMSEAINEAKEITVNFNRKGSGKMISLEESKYLTDRHGQPLNKVERWAVVGLSSIAPLGRRFIMFFNAAIQGLNAMYKLVKNNPGKMVGWSLGYLAVGALNALLHAMMDDDDDYLDMPDYERRNSLMIGGNGTYFKWALPQEARAFYALGDLAVESIMGRNPHQNVIAEALKIGTEILPVNPTEGWKAFMPSVAIPFIELGLNEDYKGAPIYNEQKWLSEEEREMTAKWAKAYQGTGTMYVEIAKVLNELTGGDARDAGLINIQPEKMQHLVQSAFGGTIRTVDKFFTMITSALDPEEEVTIRQTPFLNRLFTINDERFKNAHVNDVFDYYKKEAEHVVALQKGYIKDRDANALDKLRASEEYRWAQIYSRYKKPLKAIQEKIKVAAGTAERKELLKQQDELKKRMIKEISEL